MFFRKYSLMLLVALFGFTAGMPARADLDIAQSPLFLITPITPALIMGVDNSGSMDSEVMLPTNDGALWWHDGRDTFTGWETDDAVSIDIWTGSSELNFNQSGVNNNTWHKYNYLFPNGNSLRRLGDDHHAIPPLPQYAYVRSHVFNPIYFDPSQEYLPLPSEGTETFGNADPVNAYWDIIYSNNRVDLTNNIQRDEDGWVFRMQEGMVIPAGTILDDPDQGNSCDSSDLDWQPAPADIVLGSGDMFNGPTGDNDSCRIAIEYFPATFWLPADMPTPDGFIGTALTGGEAPDGTAMLGYEIRPGNFSNYGEMIQNFANWFQYYRKRTHLTRSAIGQAFETSNFLRVGSFRINSRNDVNMLDMSSDADRQEFFDFQYGLRAGGGTPNKQSVLHIGRQFERTGTNAPILEACQKNFGVLFTDGFSNNYTGAGVGNTDGDASSDLFGTFLADNEDNTMADIAYNFYANNLRPDLAPGKVPVPAACESADPALQLDCQKNLHMNFFAVMLGGTGIEFRQNEAATEDPWTNNPTWPTNFPNRNPTAIDDIWHAALNTRGEAFSADRPQDLIQTFRSLLQEVASRIQPVGISATSTRLDQDSLYYQAELDSTDWSGDVLARRASDDTLAWSADNRLNLSGWSNRNIVTLNADGDGLEDFEPGMTAQPNVFSIGTLFDQEQVINFVRGEQVNEEQNGGSLRDRDGMMADIANSRPTFSGPRNEGWGRLDDSYIGYVDNQKQTRTPLILVGSNGGMLHGFDSTNGNEEFAYIPGAVQANLPLLADPAYSHRFYVDGQVTVADAKLGTWSTVAVGGFGAGARGVYALDITDPDDPELIWELSADDHPELGHVFSEPIVTRLGSGEWVAIFGNGYNSDNDDAYLFVVTLNESPSVRKIELDVSATVNGLSGPASFLDPVDRLYTARVYAGDIEGNMWRIDFNESGADSKPFGNAPLINVGRPITASPSLAANPAGGLMVYFGSGKLIEPSDRIASTNPPLEQFWAVRDQESPVSPSALGEAEITVSDGNRVVSSTGSVSNGFRIELEDGSSSGERVLSRPEVVFGRLVFTTYEPLEDPCAPGGLPRIYLLNALSGSGLIPQLCPNCGVIELEPGAPIDPAIVLRPPTPPDYDAGDEPDPFNPGGGEVPGVSSVGSRDGWCSELLILTPEGFISGGPLCDGRQIWMERRPGT